MNAKELYREIGMLDDDLIEDAANAYTPKRHNKMNLLNKWIAVAACFAVVIAVSLLGNIGGNTIQINEMYSIMSPKVDISHNDRIVQRYITENEVLNYLGIDIVSELPNGMKKQKQTEYSVFYNKDGSVYYDVFAFYYLDTENNQKQLELKVSKTGFEYGYVFIDLENAQKSTLNGVSMIIGQFKIPIRNEMEQSHTTYVAEFEQNGIFYTITAKHFEENEFIKALEVFVRE